MLQSGEESMMDERAKRCSCSLFLPSLFRLFSPLHLLSSLHHCGSASQTIPPAPLFFCPLWFYHIFLPHHLKLPSIFMFDFWSFYIFPILCLSHLVSSISLRSVLLLLLLSCFWSVLLYPQSLQGLWINGAKVQNKHHSSSVQIIRIYLQRQKKKRWWWARFNSSWKDKPSISEELHWYELCPLRQIDEVCVFDRRETCYLQPRGSVAVAKAVARMYDSLRSQAEAAPDLLSTVKARAPLSVCRFAKRFQWESGAWYSHQTRRSRSGDRQAN